MVDQPNEVVVAQPTKTYISNMSLRGGGLVIIPLTMILVDIYRQPRKSVVSGYVAIPMRFTLSGFSILTLYVTVRLLTFIHTLLLTIICNLLSAKR